MVLVCFVACLLWGDVVGQNVLLTHVCFMQKSEGTLANLRSIFSRSQPKQGKIIESTEASGTTSLEATQTEEPDESDEIRDLQAERTQLMGREDYYKCLSRSFEQQLQHAVQLYQQSQTLLIQLEQETSIRDEKTKKALQVTSTCLSFISK